MARRSSRSWSTLALATGKNIIREESVERRTKLGFEVVIMALTDYLLPEQLSGCKTNSRSSSDKYTAERFLFGKDPAWVRARCSWLEIAGINFEYFEDKVKKLRKELKERPGLLKIIVKRLKCKQLLT